MEKRKQTPADQRGGRTKRQPRDPAPGRKRSKGGPIDDLYDEGETVDRDLDFEGGTYDGPPRH